MENGEGTDDVLPETLEITLDQTRSDPIWTRREKKGSEIATRRPRSRPEAVLSQLALRGHA